MLAPQHRAVSADHLGNVRATVSDMLIPRGSGVFDADLRTLTDYYPFGMTMPERSYAAAGIDGHRYGYNGKENDNEVKGEGNQQDYGFRIYDPRVARFLSVDPLAPDYPSWSPYPFAMNRPIDGVDLDGKEFYAVNEASRISVIKYLQHQFGSTAAFTWSSNGRLIHNPALQSRSASQLRTDLLNDFLAIVNATNRPVLFIGNHTVGERTPFEATVDVGNSQRHMPNMSTASMEASSTLLHVSGLIFVIMDPERASEDEFLTAVAGRKTDPCASCVFIHELLDHAFHGIASGSLDPPNARNQGDLVRRHNDALRNVGIDGQRTGNDHDPPGGTAAPERAPEPRGPSDTTAQPPR